MKTDESQTHSNEMTEAHTPSTSERHASRWLRRHGTTRGAILVLVVGVLWEVVAAHVRSRGLSGAPLVPTLQHLILKSLPRVAAFTSTAGSPRVVQGWGAVLPAFGKLVVPALVSTMRVVIGLCSGVVGGVVLGFMVGRIRGAGGLVAPLLQALRVVPFVVLVPLFTLWFGQSSVGVETFIAIGVFAVIFTITVTLVAAAPGMFQDYARTLGASWLSVETNVVLPWLMLRMRGPLSLAVGVAWTLDVAGELLGVQSGLGVLMEDSLRFAYTGRMIVLIVIYALLATLTTRAVIAMSNRLPGMVSR